MHDIFVSVLCIQELGLINVDKDAVISSDKGLSEVTHFNLIVYKLQLWEEMSSLSQNSSRRFYDVHQLVYILSFIL